MQQRRRPKPKRGMSLLEIMVVITLIGLVTAAIGVAVMNQGDAAHVKIAREQAYEIGKGVEMYRLSTGHYPSTTEGLVVLANPPKGKPLLDSLPRDPWGNDYVYVVPGMKNPNKFDVRSKGPDGQDGTDDDVGNWAAE